MRFRRRVALWRGVWRSLAIYRFDRRHRKSLARLYASFVRPGDLVFDIGAHVGDRTAAFAGLGARVVAVEPQPHLARFLRLAFAGKSRVTVIEAAVGDRAGPIRLNLNLANPTVASASDAFVEAAGRGGEAWSGQVWEDTVDVPATTLDQLIAEHGHPAFVKIDVEGFEDKVLDGLSDASLPPALSFEFVTLDRSAAQRALERAASLGYRHFNLSLGESHTMMFETAQPVPVLAETLATLSEEANSGDVYCFLRPEVAG